MADFKEYRKITFADIAEYVKEQAPEYSETLKEQVNHSTSFLTIKREFYDKYFPDLKPKAKPQNMKDKFETLFGK